MSELTQEDYKKVLKFYEQDIPQSRTNLVKKAEEIIAQKLCACIKKINKNYTDEPKSIGICKNSVLKKKNLKVHSFKCKKSKLLPNKKSQKLLKTGDVPNKRRKTRKRN